MSGRIALVTASTQEPITRTEAKLWLRLDEHEVGEDPMLDSLIRRARDRFETVTQRSCLVQTFDYYLDEVPDGSAPLCLPKAPLVAVTSIKGFSSTEASDTGGTAATIADFYVDVGSEFGRLMPISAGVYPTATRVMNPIIIRFTAGYSTSTTGVPEGVKTEIKQMVAALYEHRGDEPEQARILDAYRGAEYALPTWG